MKEAQKSVEQQAALDELADQHSDEAAVERLRQRFVEAGGGDDEFDQVLKNLGTGEEPAA